MTGPRCRRAGVRPVSTARRRTSRHGLIRFCP